LYSPIYTSVLGTIGKGRLWAQDGRPESMAVAQSPETPTQLIQNDYKIAKAKWNDWMTEATK
jgi:hypothetical protein